MQKPTSEPNQSQLDSEQLIQDFINSGYDPFEMQDLFTDMLIWYLHPMDNWQPEPEVVRDILGKSIVFLDLLRGIRTGKFTSE